MSATAAHSLPLGAPQQRPASQPGPSAQPRHIEIVTTRNQRLARPRLVYSLITVAGLFAVLAS